MFALAALIIGGIDAVASRYAPPPPELAEPSGSRVAAGVGAFVALYALSAFLAGPCGFTAARSSFALWPLALLLWRLCDPSTPSLSATGR